MKRSYILILLTATLLYGCDGVLEKIPLDNISSDV